MPKKAKAAKAATTDDERAPQHLPDAPEIMQIPTSHGPLGDVNGMVEVYTKDMSRIMLGVSDVTQQAAEMHGWLDDFSETAADLYRKIEMLEGRLNALEQAS
jgi:hypothetical protein